MEEWKDIKGYEGLYQVSNEGRVKSLCYYKGKKEKILKLNKHNNGRISILLYKDGIARCCSVHRLVAEAFIPNPNNLPQINHRDENPQNNQVENLEWCDSKYNANYGTRNKKISESRKNHYYFRLVAACCRGLKK